MVLLCICVTKSSCKFLFYYFFEILVFFLQNNIKLALVESGCPAHILDDLVKNCHERNWPSGLSSLETRQHNRRHYDRYNCKRIPGKQAVIVLPCDNIMVSDDMMSEPGLIMIFAHGIE